MRDAASQSLRPAREWRRWPRAGKSSAPPRPNAHHPDAPPARQGRLPARTLTPGLQFADRAPQEGLSLVLQHIGEWDDAERSLALDLLRIPPNLRTPGTTKVDALPGEDKPPVARLQAIVEAELARLREWGRSEFLETLDTMERKQVIHMGKFLMNDEARLAERYRAEHSRRHQASIRELQRRERTRDRQEQDTGRGNWLADYLAGTGRTKRPPRPPRKDSSTTVVSDEASPAPEISPAAAAICSGSRFTDSSSRCPRASVPEDDPQGAQRAQRAHKHAEERRPALRKSDASRPRAAEAVGTPHLLNNVGVSAVRPTRTWNSDKDSPRIAHAPTRSSLPIGQFEWSWQTQPAQLIADVLTFPRRQALPWLPRPPFFPGWTVRGRFARWENAGRRPQKTKRTQPGPPRKRDKAKPGRRKPNPPVRLRRRKEPESLPQEDPAPSPLVPLIPIQSSPLIAPTTVSNITHSCRH